MNKEEIQKIVRIRAELIEIYNWLPGKNEPSALVKSKDVAQQLAIAISKIDAMLEGKVTFAKNGG